MIVHCTNVGRFKGSNTGTGININNRSPDTNIFNDFPVAIKSVSLVSGVSNAVQVVTDAQNDEILTLCPVESADAGNIATASSACQCVFSYSSPAVGGDGEFKGKVFYSESSLLRCSYDGLPADVASFKVAIQIEASGLQSNFSDPVDLNASGLMSTSNISSYVKISRYVCHQTTMVPSLFSTINLSAPTYDPLQTDQKANGIALNYYTNNFTRSMVVFSTNQQSWNANKLRLLDHECPFLMNPEVNDLQWDPSKAQRSDRSPLDQNPLLESFKKSFYLFQYSFGLFNRPVQAFIAPVFTELIGYAAAPLPSGSCPTVPIPAGYVWKKLWLLSNSQKTKSTFYFAPRLSAVDGTQLTNKLAIKCNPKNGPALINADNWFDAAKNPEVISGNDSLYVWYPDVCLEPTQNGIGVKKTRCVYASQCYTPKPNVLSVRIFEALGTTSSDTGLRFAVGLTPMGVWYQLPQLLTSVGGITTPATGPDIPQDTASTTGFLDPPLTRARKPLFVESDAVCKDATVSPYASLRVSATAQVVSRDIVGDIKAEFDFIFLVTSPSIQDWSLLPNIPGYDSAQNGVLQPVSGVVASGLFPVCVIAAEGGF